MPDDRAILFRDQRDDGIAIRIERRDQPCLVILPERGGDDAGDGVGVARLGGADQDASSPCANARTSSPMSSRPSASAKLALI